MQILISCAAWILFLCIQIPVSQTIQLILDSIYSDNKSIYNGFNKKQFKKVLELVLNDTFETQ